MRISGIGVTLLGVSNKQPDGTATATWWFTFLYLPVLPVRRVRVRFLPHKGSGISFEEISDEDRIASEILKTYLYGWILIPLLIFWPLILSIVMNNLAAKLPQPWQIPAVVFMIVWILGWILILLSWHEKKYKP